MPSITIKDNILAPKNKLVMRYKGEDPFSIARMLNSYLKDLLKVSSSKIYEDDVRWDKTGEPRPFFGMWRVRGGEDLKDNWSQVWFAINYQGEQPIKQGQQGELRIEIKGFLQTKIPYHNFLQKAAWWVYFKIFYNEQRREYLDRAKDYTLRMKEAFQRELGIIPEGYE